MPFLTPEVLDPVQVTCKRLRIPQGFVQLVAGALLELTYEYNWEAFGAVTVEDCAEAMRNMHYDYMNSPEVCMIGAIFPYISANPPGGTLPCDGRIVLGADYPLLEAAVDNFWKIISPDGRVAIQLPDLRGRFPLGASVSALPGTRGGSETHILTIGEMPSHAHTTQPHTHTTQPHSHTNLPHDHIFAMGIDINIPVVAPGETPVTFNTGIPTIINVSPSGVIIDATEVAVDNATVSVNPTGDGQAHNNMPPFVALNYCIVVS